MVSFSFDNPMRWASRHIGDGGVVRLLNCVHHTPKRMGQLLLLSVGLVVCCTALFVARGVHAHLTLLLVSVAMLLILACTTWLPAAPPRASVFLIFPCSVMTALGMLGLTGGGLGSPYGGVMVLCFAYTGLTQSSRTNVLLLPYGAASYVGAMGSWDTALAIRLFVVTCVWFLLSQLLCGLTARNASLTAAPTLGCAHRHFDWSGQSPRP